MLEEAVHSSNKTLASHDEKSSAPTSQPLVLSPPVSQPEVSVPTEVPAAPADFPPPSPGMAQHIEEMASGFEPEPIVWEEALRRAKSNRDYIERIEQLQSVWSEAKPIGFEVELVLIEKASEENHIVVTPVPRLEKIEPAKRTYVFVAYKAEQHSEELWVLLPLGSFQYYDGREVYGSLLGVRESGSYSAVESINRPARLRRIEGAIYEVRERMDVQFGTDSRSSK
jgi:hypothetical protein